MSRERTKLYKLIELSIEKLQHVWRSLIIIHISCDSAEKVKEANIASIRLNDLAVFDNKSHSVR